MPGREEACNLRVGQRGDEFHRRRHVLVRRQHREVLGHALQQGCGSRHRRRLEPGREERHLVASCARDVDCLRDAVDHVYPGARCLRIGQRAGRAGDAHHVAVGRHAHALVRERHGLVHFGHVGDADGAARSHDHVELLRQDGAEAEPGDGLLVAATDVHHRDPVAIDLGDHAFDRAGERSSPCGVAELQLAGAARELTWHDGWPRSRRVRPSRRRPSGRRCPPRG